MIIAFIKKHSLAICLFILALSVRTYHLEATLTFLEDEGRDMLIAYRMIETMRPVLLGPQTSTGDMYLGPLYYYFITPALYLSGLSPLGPAFLIALTGAITATLLYFIGTSWFGRGAGVLSAILYALMPLPVVFTRNSWNPNLAPLISLLIIYVTVKLIEKGTDNKRLYIYLGALFGVLIQLHYMALIFLGGVGLTLLLYRWRLFKSLLIGGILALASFTFVLSPFIVFELRNDFVNTKAITRFVEADEVHNIRYTMPLELWANKVGSTTTRLISSLYGKDALTPDPNRNLITISIISLIVLTFIVILHRQSTSSSRIYILGLLFFIPLGVVGIYQENIHLHYLGFFFPLLYLMTSSTLSLPKLRYIGLGFSIILMLYSFPQLKSYLNSSGTNQLKRANEVAAYIVRNANGQSYNLVSNQKTNTTPYQYFVAISDNPPTTKRAQTLFMICQDRQCSTEDITSRFIFITGPAHPTLEQYIGHPLYYQFEGKRTIVSNDHVSNGIWVAKLLVE